jgi:hypothetical protein
MILPRKHLPLDLTLLAIGAQIIDVLDQPTTVEELWARSRRERGVISFDRFCAALTFLYVIDLVDLSTNLLTRTSPRR